MLGYIVCIQVSLLSVLSMVLVRSGDVSDSIISGVVYDNAMVGYQVLFFFFMFFFFFSRVMC